MSLLIQLNYLIFVFITFSLPQNKGLNLFFRSSRLVESVRKQNLIVFSLFRLYTAQLSKNLHYYESIHADDIIHKIVKRGTKHSNHPFNVIKEVEFKVLGRHFRIILHPQKDVLHSNFKAYSVDGNGHEKVVHFGNSFDSRLEFTECILIEYSYFH